MPTFKEFIARSYEYLQKGFNVSPQRRPRDPVKIHREWCRGIEAEAQQKVSRPLTTDERDKIWNCGSFHFLEILERDVMACQTPTELEKCLAEFPFLGPLPPKYTVHD